MTQQQPGGGASHKLMAFVLALEAVIALGAVFLMLQQMFAERQAVLETEHAVDLTVQTVGLIALVLIGAVWIIATCIGALRERSWASGSNLTLQVLMLATATGVLQGMLQPEWFGWVLLVLAVLGIVATIMVKRQATHRDAQRDSAVDADPSA